MMTETRFSPPNLTVRQLPAGFTVRPATIDDVEAAANLFNAVSRAVWGIDSYHASDLANEWQEPGFSPETDARLVFDPNGRLAAYQEVFSMPPYVRIHTWNQVHPDYTGQGVAAWLLEWAEQRAWEVAEKAPADTRVIMTGFVPVLSQRGLGLYRKCGFDLVRYNLRMIIDLPSEPPAPVWPDGITVRTINVDTEVPAVALAVRESFRDHYGFVERPWEDDLKHFRHHMADPEYFDPELYFVAWDGDQIAGISLCMPKWYDDAELGWVSTLGVLREWRRRGLGLALLQHSFQELYRRGKRRVGLGVDASSLTGATKLYEKAGMHSDESRKFALFEKELRPGIELSTQSV
jgi:GNAT superfamily N-acetyltransferase